MSDNDAPPPDFVNWEAYSHEELYRMLWQEADVGSVSTVATEWTRHRAALDTHAEVLREQRAALLDGWSGVAAEEAVRRLGVLAERIEKISELASAGQRAAQDAADALATARAAMPPPPATAGPAGAGPATAGPAGVEPTNRSVEPTNRLAEATNRLVEPTNWSVEPTNRSVEPTNRLVESTNWSVEPTNRSVEPTNRSVEPTDQLAGVESRGVGADGVWAAGAEPFALPSAPASFTSTSAAPAPFALPSAPAPLALPSAPTFNPGMGTAFGAVGTAGFSFYFGAAATDQQKAQAVRAMQGYESSLTSSSKLIDDARGNVPPAASTQAPASTVKPGGVPWQRLVGGGSAGAPRGMAGGFSTPGTSGMPSSPSPANVPAPGMRAGVMFNGYGSAVMSGPLENQPGQRGAAQAGMVPPASGARGDDDQEHENQMPTLDHGLFELDERACPPVIGEMPEVQA